MERWRVNELVLLADAIAAAGLGSFQVRRTLQRLERGELTVLQAVRTFRMEQHHPYQIR